MITDADLQQAREFLRIGRNLAVSDATLITLGNTTTLETVSRDVVKASEWAYDEAIPLVQELAFRLRRALLWIMPPGGESITAEGLLMMGFRRDESHGHVIYLHEAIDDVEGCHTALHLIADQGGGFAAEIHNWQTEHGERMCDVNQRVALPRVLKTYNDVRRLCASISERWMTRVGKHAAGRLLDGHEYNEFP